jgi:hypothetical protein
MRRLSENGTIGLNDGRPAVVSAVPIGLIGDLEFCALRTVHALVIKIVGRLCQALRRLTQMSLQFAAEDSGHYNW